MNDTILVTGAASGLGRVIAADLLGSGRRLVLIDRDAEALKLVETAFRKDNCEQLQTIVADLSTIEGVHEAAHEVRDAGGIGGLVNNAGGWLPGEQYPLAPTDKWLSALTLNLVAPMLLTHLLWPQLVAAVGAVVTIGSSGGLGDAPYGSPEYGAAKAGVRRFTASLGSRTDVRVMAVVPGWIGLERAHIEWSALSPEEQQRIGPLIAPEAIAATVSRLLDHGRAGEIVEMLNASDTENQRRRHE